MEKQETVRPSPDDFDLYLPWACAQLQVEATVLIIRVLQNEYVSAGLTDRSKSRGKSKLKLGQSQPELDSDQDKEDKGLQSYAADQNVIKVYTFYDSCDKLVHIKFDKIRSIPRTVFKIIGLIVKFQPYLTSITINRGLDVYSIHELCKIIHTSHITDLCLDDTFLGNTNISILLEKTNNIRYLSLSRCKINDEILKKIADNLFIHLPSSKTIAVLNISSNLITDVGVTYLAEVLRSNRNLVYLNLADNMVTDDGASAILDILMEFPMTANELIDFRRRLMKHLKEKQEMITKIVTELRNSDSKSAKKKSGRPSSFPTKKLTKGLEKESSLKSVAEGNKSNTAIDAILFEKAEILAENAIGGFNDPFSKDNTVSKDGVAYCCGNNVLCYLNLAYNNLTYQSLKKLLNVLMYQKLMDRKPRGLINLVIEGNSIPMSCKELAQIDDILEMGLMMQNRRNSAVRKKPLSRSGR